MRLSIRPTSPAPRRFIAVGALLTVIGLAIASTSPILGAEGSERTQAQQVAGGLVVLAGWALLVWGLHRFGRASPT